MGLKRRKVGQIPAKADVEKQADFLKNELEPRLEEAKEGKRQVFFIDASHFVLAAFLGYLWCFTRIFIKSPSGRQRYNVLGALNAITLDLVTVTNDAYINAISVIELMKKIIEKCGVIIPITLVLDNAKYQKCAAVKEYADKKGIELLYLPSYSPNLNLIERLWKFVKKKCLYCEYYDSFSKFKNAIDSCLDNICKKHKYDIKSLMTLKFQVLKYPNL
jgi:transposase